MPPTLAAIIYVAFILWCLRRFGKVAPLSIGTLIVFLWIGNNVTRPIGYWLASGTVAASAEPSDGSFFDRNFYLILMVCATIALVRRPVEWRTVLTEMRPLLWFQVYLLVSCAWSVEPFISFKRWVKDAGELLIILLVLTDQRPVEVLKGVFIRCAIIFVPLSVLFMKYYPTIGRYTHQWSWSSGFCGITLSKNALGLLAMLSGLFLLWYFVDVLKLRNWRSFLKVWPELAVFVMCVWILWIAQSATALTSFIAAGLVFFLVRLGWVRSNMKLLAALVVLVATLLLEFSVSPDLRASVAYYLNRDGTLTERTEIWERSLKLGTDPLFGTGFFSVWLRPEAADFVREFHLSHAHNAYLETYLNSGFVGLGFLAFLLIRSSRRAAAHLANRTERVEIGPLFMALVISGLLYNYTEVTFNRSNAFGFLLWLMAAFSLRHASVAEIPDAERESIVWDEFGSGNAETVPVASA